MKTLIYLYLFFTLVSCKISGTYNWVKLNTKLNPELIEKLDAIVPDPNLKYYRWDVFELKFQTFGNMQYRFTKRLTEGGTSFNQDLPFNNGKWEFNNDTLSIYYSVNKSDVAYLYKLSGDTLIPINNKTYWMKEK